MKRFRKQIQVIVALLFILFLLKGIAVAKEGDIPEIYGKLQEYTAKRGEDLYPIARKFNLAIEHLMFANGLKGIKTRPGQKLRIPLRRTPPSTDMYNGVVLNLPERGLYLYEKGKVVNFYPVAIGAPGKWMTPTGDFKIITKVKNPTWLPPEWAKEEEPVPAGPNNPLGDRWMGLNKPGYGIHATNRPVSIGLATSHGCIRMYPELAHKLFEKVKVGTPVKIIYEPVKIGYDPANKRLFMEVYPDIYGKTPGLLKYAKMKLAEYNLLGLVDEGRLKLIIAKHRGFPEPILGSDIVIKVNERKQKLSFSPFLKDGKVWTTSEVLKPIGAVLVWNNKDKAVDIYKGKKKISLQVIKGGNNYSVANKKKPVSFLWNGRTIIPTSYVLKKLDINYRWSPKQKTLLVYSGDIPSGNTRVKRLPKNTLSQRSQPQNRLQSQP